MDMTEISSGPTKPLVDSGPPSVNDIQSEDFVSSADELVIRVRKPYTIQKQREKWTEEEHEKFLQALKLHGRAWRQIQEHIGSKTAVQIRSHAQKFFSKVVREPDTEKTIEIPPPRPKRKPLHPYPRKSSHDYTKKCLPVPEHYGGSPAGSGMSHRPNSCTTALSVAVGSLPDEDDSTAPGLAAFTEQYAIPMELESRSCGDNPRIEISKSEGQTTGIKLFGQTVLVPVSQKNLSSSTENPNQECSSGCISSGHMNITKTAASSTAPSEQCFNPCQDQDGVPQMYYYLATNSDPSNQMEAFTTLAPCWTFCGNLYETSIGDDVEKESSSTELRSVCETRAVIDNNISKVEVNEHAENSALHYKLTTSEKSAFTRVTVSSNNSTRGFVPYKRCVGGHQAQQYAMRSNDKETQAVRLCL